MYHLDCSLSLPMYHGSLFHTTLDVILGHAVSVEVDEPENDVWQRSGCGLAVTFVFREEVNETSSSK